ncbi:MAG: hypothetical protein GY765_07785 [bacterium]|nr:hypothetical protein [bacterium]
MTNINNINTANTSNDATCPTPRGGAAYAKEYCVKIRSANGGYIEVPHISPNEVSLEDMNLNLRMLKNSEGKYSIIQQSKGLLPHMMGNSPDMMGLSPHMMGVKMVLDVYAGDANGQNISLENFRFLTRLDLEDDFLKNLLRGSEFTVKGKLTVLKTTMDGLVTENPDLSLFFVITMVKDASITAPLPANETNAVLSLNRYFAPSTAPSADDTVLVGTAIKIRDLKKYPCSKGNQEEIEVEFSATYHLLFVDAKDAYLEREPEALEIEASANGISIHLDVEIRMVKDASITAPQTGDYRLLVTWVALVSREINGVVYAAMTVVVEMVKDASITAPTSCFHLWAPGTKHTSYAQVNDTIVSFTTRAPATTGGGSGFAGHPATPGGNSGFAGHPATPGGNSGFAGHPATPGGGSGFAGQSQTGGIRVEPLHDERELEFVGGTAKKSYGKIRDGIMHIGGTEYPVTNIDPDRPADALYSKKPVDDKNKDNDNFVNKLIKFVWGGMKDIFDGIFGSKK